MNTQFKKGALEGRRLCDHISGGVRIGSGEKILQADGKGERVPDICKAGMESIYQCGKPVNSGIGGMRP